MDWLLITFYLIGLAYGDEESRTVLRVQPNSADQLDSVRNIRSVLGFGVDYLRPVRAVGGTGDIILPPLQVADIQNYLKKRGVLNWIIEDDQSLKRHRRSVDEDMDLSAGVTPDVITSDYLSYDNQMRILRKLTATYPRLIRLDHIGNSSENRHIITATIGYRCNSSKPILWIDSGIHAREWITHPVALYSIYELVTNPAYSSLLRQIDIVIVPNANPDGYEYSRSNNRLWRKTRSRNPNSGCWGVDGNRNYPFHWAEEGSSFSPCSEIFAGMSVSSEPEVRALVRRITSLRERIKGYVALHSYGQSILYPWGHAVHQYPPDVEDLKNVANEMMDAIKAVRGTVYNVANSGDGLYPASGAADDWAKSIGVKYSYTIELSPSEFDLGEKDNGFVVQENLIKPIAVEMLAGLHTLALRVAQEPVKRRSPQRSRG